MYVLVAGAGKVGWNLARELIAKGHEVTLVEHNRRRYLIVEQELEHAVQYGDATELWVLERAGIQRADMVIAVTGDDEDNMLICQVAKEKYLVERIIARVNNPRNLQHFKLLGIQPAVSATDLILRLIEHEVPKYGLVHLLDLEEEQLEIIEMEVADDAPAAGRKVVDIDLPDGSPDHLGAARAAAASCPRPTPSSRPATRSCWCSTPALEDDITAQFAPNGQAASSHARHVDVLLIGGGLAAANCARWLREEGVDGVDPAGRPRARPALQPAAVLEGLPAGQGAARGRPLPPRRVVGRSRTIELLHAHERDAARSPAAATATLSTQEEICVRQGAARHRRRTCAGCASTACELEGIHYLRALRQLRRDPRGRRGRRARRADRRLLHRHARSRPR